MLDSGSSFRKVHLLPTSDLKFNMIVKGAWLQTFKKYVFQFPNSAFEQNMYFEATQWIVPNSH